MALRRPTTSARSFAWSRWLLAIASRRTRRIEYSVAASTARDTTRFTQTVSRYASSASGLSSTYLLHLTPTYWHDLGGPWLAGLTPWSGLDQLLRTLLPVRVGPAAEPDQRTPRPLGHAQVQAAATPLATPVEVPRWGRSARPKPLRPLAYGAATGRSGNGSCVTGDCQARFWEGRGVKLPRRLAAGLLHNRLLSRDPACQWPEQSATFPRSSRGFEPAVTET